MAAHQEARVHPSAEVADGASIGTGSSIWHQAQVREGAVIGRDCVVGKGAYIDHGVRIGDRCKIQNGAYVFHGYDLEDGVFIGPGAMLLNDLKPRAINADGSQRAWGEWAVSRGLVQRGASIGGGAVLLPGVKVGRWAMVGAGSVVTHNVIEHGLVYGNPARMRGYVCDCGTKLPALTPAHDPGTVECPACGTATRIEPEQRGSTGAESR